MTTSLGSQADATTTYTFGIAADREDGGAPGYDVLSAPVVNAAHLHASCAVTSGPETIIEPGVGGTDKSIGRQVTISQDKGTTCVIDWYERLALGSHLFPGSSLHTNRTNQQWSTSGIGAADVSIPVNEILPQEPRDDGRRSWPDVRVGHHEVPEPDVAELRQHMPRDHRLSKPERPDHGHLDALRADGERRHDDQYGRHRDQPAHRTITVQATDKMYEGATQTTQLDQTTGAAVDVPALTSMVVLNHSFVYNGSATTFNYVATATYTDKVTGIPVPGATSATASAHGHPGERRPGAVVGRRQRHRIDHRHRAWRSRSRPHRSAPSPAAMSQAHRPPAPWAGSSPPRTAAR